MGWDLREGRHCSVDRSPISAAESLGNIRFIKLPVFCTRKGLDGMGSTGGAGIFPGTYGTRKPLVLSGRPNFDVLFIQLPVTVFCTRKGLDGMGSTGGAGIFPGTYGTRKPLV